MLINPAVKAQDDGYRMPIISHGVIPAQTEIPEFAADTELRLAETQYVNLIEVHPNQQIKPLGQYTLDKFVVGNGAASWSFTSDTGSIIEGSSMSRRLTDKLSVKLKMPVVLLPSKVGLRPAFIFRVENPQYRVVSGAVYREMIGEQG